jgi:transposase
MMVCMRSSGIADQLEKRRRRVIALLQAGTPYREVARRVAASLAEAGTARPPARRGGHRSVEAERMAPVKKTPGAGARISCSSTKPGLS